MYSKWIQIRDITSRQWRFSSVSKLNSLQKYVVYFLFHPLLPSKSLLFSIATDQTEKGMLLLVGRSGDTNICRKEWRGAWVSEEIHPLSPILKPVPIIFHIKEQPPSLQPVWTKMGLQDMSPQRLISTHCVTLYKAVPLAVQRATVFVCSCTVY